MIRAVTFDFWNTVMWEPEGALVAARMPVLMEVLGDAGVDVTRERLEAAHGVAFRRYQQAWMANEQYRVPGAVDTILAELGLDGTGGLRDAMVEGFSEAGRRAGIHLAEGVEQCLRDLHAAHVRIGIVCDIGLTPSPVIRWHLERRGLFELFDGWTFSDEIGAYKPDHSMFEHALGELGTEAGHAAHVGDRKRTDVAGAIAAGMTAVRYRGVYDDVETPEPEAHHVVDHHDEIRHLVIGNGA